MCERQARPLHMRYMFLAGGTTMNTNSVEKEIKPTDDGARSLKTERGFTPGPWAQSALAAGYVISLADDHEVVCSFVEYNKDGTVELEFKNAANNMALVIAAPALYEACRQFVHWYAEDSTEFNRDTAYDNAVAALALVDGPQTKETK